MGAAFPSAETNAVGILSEVARQSSAAQRPPSIVAGVRLVDTKIAITATELSQSVSPPYLFNHAVRTFLFGSLA